MTKREKWEKMIECVENDSASKEEIVRFLKANQPKESVKKVPCVCGAKSCNIAEWWSIRTGCCFLRCRKCDRESKEAKTVTQARRNWNEMVKKENENGASD